jgi:hypothetical protein
MEFINDREWYDFNYARETKQCMIIRDHEQFCFEMFIISLDNVWDVGSIILLKYFLTNRHLKFR